MNAPQESFEIQYDPDREVSELSAVLEKRAQHYRYLHDCLHVIVRKPFTPYRTDAPPGAPR